MQTFEYNLSPVLLVLAVSYWGQQSADSIFLCQKKQWQRARQSGVKKQMPEEVEMKGQPSEGSEGSKTSRVK